MHYLTGEKSLNDESDHEDPAEAINVPALQNNRGGY